MKSKTLELFGNRIRELRLKMNWTQQELADHTGFHKNYVGMIERGEKNISLKNIELFAQSFKISISELLKYSDEL